MIFLILDRYISATKSLGSLTVEIWKTKFVVELKTWVYPISHALLCISEGKLFEAENFPPSEGSTCLTGLCIYHSYHNQSLKSAKTDLWTRENCLYDSKRECALQCIFEGKPFAPENFPLPEGSTWLTGLWIYHSYHIQSLKSAKTYFWTRENCLYDSKRECTRSPLHFSAFLRENPSLWKIFHYRKALHGLPDFVFITAIIINHWKASKLS